MLCPDAGRVNTATMRRLSKEVFHGTHRQEEPSLDSGQLEKSILCIKRECSSILCVDDDTRSEEHTSELQSRLHLVCRLLLEKKKEKHERQRIAHPDKIHSLRQRSRV